MKENLNGGRIYGIDLLKILSMFMIIVLHVLGQGGILDNATNNKPLFWTAWFMETLAFCAVNCFALATGFLMVGHKFKYRKIVPLWLTVFFYSIAFLIVAKLVKPEAVTINKLFFIMPATSAEYWYFTAYFCMFFFIPFLNILIDTLSKKQFYILLLTGFLVFSVSSIISTSLDCFKLSDGYSAWWLIYLYLLGAGIKKYKMFDFLSAGMALFGYVGTCTLAWASKLFMTLIIRSNVPVLATLVKGYDTDRFIRYTSPAIVMAAVFFMMFCLKVRIPKFTHKGLAWLSPLVFQVYIIHLNFLPWNYVIHDRFASFAEKPTALMVLLTLATALAIFIICIFIDWLRSLLFKFLKVNKIVDITADRISVALKKHILKQSKTDYSNEKEAAEVK